MRMRGGVGFCRGTGVSQKSFLSGWLIDSEIESIIGDNNAPL
jgi:hypothetical protein